ncbi:hypothetical protein EL22_00840 [Halostagnicola sp. A56]|uniref:hypothetical protein n=1 Tax=Halostagnicola sp. A56 TaxID=1495067 RepID=UPI0004A170EB|nr:hypothetical protein [Halostagnicola sp. A56]KDE56752.1 hypothetical protein EL22_21375 [Halostagnicola sp. A56]KDE58997.1 hypothetical protein EL22_00840 [Halostagnicola sp. A56]
MSSIDETVFSEPSGGLFALVQLCGAFLLSGIYVYYVIMGNSTVGSWVLFAIVGTALSGIAESLPKSRGRAAGVLRLTAIFVQVGLLVALFFAPELLIG